MRDADPQGLARFDGFFARSGILLADVSAQVLDRASELRARHGFRTPDAIHLATALAQSADVFLTGDSALARCPGLQVTIVDPAIEG